MKKPHFQLHFALNTFKFHRCWWVMLQTADGSNWLHVTHFHSNSGDAIQEAGLLQLLEYQ